MLCETYEGLQSQKFTLSMLSHERRGTGVERAVPVAR